MRVLIGLVFLGLLTGCENKASVPKMQIFGNPPGNATIGVVYEYQFGIKGGDGLLEYSLTNAPPWLSVEYVENRLLRGILIKGTPGISGKGTTDYEGTTGEFEGIELNVTDGKSVGRLRFSMSVRPNQVRLPSRTFVEGETMTRPRRLIDTNSSGTEDPGEVYEDEPLCLLDEAGQPLLNDAELAFLETDLFRKLTQRELNRRPTLQYLDLTLFQASVIDVEGNYQLAESEFQDNFRPGVDSVSEIVIPAGLTDKSQFENASTLAELEAATGGLKTVRIDAGRFIFPAGRTKCHLLLVVADDTEAEREETISYRLNGIVGGLLEQENGSGSIRVKDNEPSVKFTVDKASVARDGVTNVIVELDKAPEVDATVRFLVDEVGSTAEFGADGDLTVRLRPEDIDSGTVLSDDLVIIDGGFELRFNVKDDTTDPILRTERQKRIQLVGQQPATGPAAPFQSDPLVQFSAERTGTINPPPSDTTFQAFINDWLTPYVAAIGPAGKTQGFGATVLDEAILAVARPGGDGLMQSQITLLDRTGTVSEQILLQSPGLNVEIKDVAYRSTGTLEREDFVEEIFTLLEVDGLFTGPLDRLGPDELGSGDLVVQKLRRLNRAGGFRVVWQKQFGTIFNEYGGALAVDRDGGVYVAGGTKGDARRENQGGYDAYLTRLSANGEQLFEQQRGGEAEEVYNAAVSVGGSDVAVAGTLDSTSITSDSTNLLDILVASFSDEGTVTRADQFGTAFDEVGLSISGVDRGFVVVGETNGAIDLSLVKNDRLTDAFALYYPTLAAPEAVMQLVSPGADGAADSDALEEQTYFGGYTGGKLFEGQTFYGDIDAWSARYDIRDNEEINRRRFFKVWERQRGTAGAERLVKLDALESAKMFEVIEYNVGGENYVSIAPVGTLDGGDLASCNPAINPDCPPQPVPPVEGE
ncbi:MAG: hypothetical protein CME36_19530 [unclassified Hahellaceae]|nr:hypothetical protein [Hahellaceae bacterium]